MENITDDVTFLKDSLRTILINIGKETTLRYLENAFSAKYGKRFSVDFLAGFITKFPQVFNVRRHKGPDLWISLKESVEHFHPVPSCSSSHHNQINNAPSKHKNVYSEDIKRFLKDCETFNPRNSKINLECDDNDNSSSYSDHAASQEIQAIFSQQNEPNDVASKVKSLFRENNPFYEDISQSLIQAGTSASEIEKLYSKSSSTRDFNPFDEFQKASSDLEFKSFPSFTGNVQALSTSSSSSVLLNCKDIVSYPHYDTMTVGYEQLIESDTSEDENETQKLSKHEIEAEDGKENDLNLKHPNDHLTQDTPEDEEFEFLENIREKMLIQSTSCTVKNTLDNSFEKLSSISGASSAKIQPSQNSIVTFVSTNYKDIQEPRFDDVALPFDDLVYYFQYPPHNRNPDLELPQPKLQKDFKNVQIFFSEIHSPVHFWFQRGKDTGKLGKLSKRIDNIYRPLKEKDLLISRANMKEGLIVIAYHAKFKDFFRARIIKVYGTSVHLYYFDYGTAATNKIENCKYILNELLEVPPLCYRGRVFGVHMDDDEGFKVDQCEKFINEVAGNTLKVSFMADCVYFDEENNTYELNIRFEHDLENVSEWIVKSKMGKLIPSDILENRENEEVTIGPMCYLFPTHEALENGDYPSFETLISYASSGKLFKTMVQTNFLHAAKEIDSNIEDMLSKNHKELKNIKKSLSMPIQTTE